MYLFIIVSQCVGLVFDKVTVQKRMVNVKNWFNIPSPQTDNCAGILIYVSDQTGKCFLLAQVNTVKNCWSLKIKPQPFAPKVRHIPLHHTECSKTWLKRPPWIATTCLQGPLFRARTVKKVYTESALRIATTCLQRPRLFALGGGRLERFYCTRKTFVFFFFSYLLRQTCGVGWSPRLISKPSPHPQSPGLTVSY